MITIKEFASLCNCNTQTLRYYDKIDLLKPYQTDPWSGYRYYAKSQVIDFIKIKNLQAAGFTIDEIKILLTMSDQHIYEAFEQKITEQLLKVKQIKEIQQSYLTEKSTMEKLIHNVADYLLHSISNFEILKEFGLSPDDGPAVVARLRNYIEKSTSRHLQDVDNLHLYINDKEILDVDEATDAIEALKDKGYDDEVLLGNKDVREFKGFTKENSKTIWSCHDWQFVYEFIDDIPPLREGQDYCFFFNLTNAKYDIGLEFSMFMIASMLLRLNSDQIVMGCCVERSVDNKNHFSLQQLI